MPKGKIHFSILISFVFFLLQIKMQSINITDCIELQNITNNLSGNYVLQANINCSSIPNFSRIGNSSFPFNGTLNGNGFYVSDINILDSTNEYVALFSYGSNVKVSNLNLMNFFVNTSNSYGFACLFGSLQNSLIFN